MTLLVHFFSLYSPLKTGKHTLGNTGNSEARANTEQVPPDSATENLLVAHELEGWPPMNLNSKPPVAMPAAYSEGVGLGFFFFSGRIESIWRGTGFLGRQSFKPSSFSLLSQRCCISATAGPKRAWPG